MNAFNSSRHKYEYTIDVESDMAGAYVVRFVGTSKRVLEVGCGPGSIARVLSRDYQCIVTGIEIDEESAVLARQYCSEVIQGDIEDRSMWARLHLLDRFDVLILADVLEHLRDPWRILSDLLSLVNKDGCIIVSLPHVGHAAMCACVLSSRFPYAQCGLLDKTHLRFFGLEDMEVLFDQAGLLIRDAAFVQLHPADTELASIWNLLCRQTKTELRKPWHSDIYQVVTLLSRKNEDKHSSGSLKAIFQNKGRGLKSRRSLKSYLRREVIGKSPNLERAYITLKRYLTLRE